MTLRLYKHAPLPLGRDRWHTRTDRMCIGINGLDWASGGGYLCLSDGKYPIKMPDGSQSGICGKHLRMYARRGYINAQIARGLLEQDAREKLAQTKKRVECLAKGRCL